MASSSTPTTISTILTTSSLADEQTFQPSDFSFLSRLLHILERTELGDDAQEIATLSSHLKTSFKKCQMILDHLPGADLSPDDQARILAEEMQILERKKAQLAEYLSWQVFDHKITETTASTPAMDPPTEASAVVKEASEEVVAKPPSEAVVETPEKTSMETSHTPLAASEASGVVSAGEMRDVKVEEDVGPSQGSDTFSSLPVVESLSPPLSQMDTSLPPQLQSGLSSAMLDINMTDADPPV